MQRLLAPVAQARKVINRKRFLEEYERTVYSKFEVRCSRLCCACSYAKPRQAKLLTVSDFSNEHERTVNSLACRLDAQQ
ncbi:MAG: hypothetical protein FWC60_05595 [Firmicutes bacterium]|nr:hypothetical protein [Bacillota bacterium]